MLPAEDLFACVYVLIHDLIIAGLVAIPPRPGPAPGCSDAELLAIVMETGRPPRDLLVDKGFTGKAFAAGQAACGTAVLLPPAKGGGHRMPPVLRKIIAEWRNRIETTFKEITDQMEIARHGAHTL